MGDTCAVTPFCQPSQAHPSRCTAMVRLQQPSISHTEPHTNLATHLQKHNAPRVVYRMPLVILLVQKTFRVAFGEK
eukprot:1566164-Amphidinium_carterae.2